MITWQALAIAGFTVAGIGCCGIGAISIFAGAMAKDRVEGANAIRGGSVVGAAGAILAMLAIVARYS